MDTTNQILKSLAIICSVRLGRNVSVDELDELYETNPICKEEIDKVIG